MWFRYWLSRTHLADMPMNIQLLLTCLYLQIYILLSSGLILYNMWVLSPKYFNFPFPITLTMVHMGSSSIITILARALQLVAPAEMTFQIYCTCVVPISVCFASSLWFGNTAYLHISVAFIQMLKALMPVATFVLAVRAGTDAFSWRTCLNMLLVSTGVIISSYGEIHLNVIGTVYQSAGIFSEALRLVLTQVLLQRRGLNLNPITTAYYIAPCSFFCLLLPWYFLEKSKMEITQILLNRWVFFSNALCAVALNFCTYLVISRSGAVTSRVAGVVKDWIVIGLSTFLFAEFTITQCNTIGFIIALSGVMYHFWSGRDVRMSNQLPAENNTGMFRRGN